MNEVRARLLAFVERHGVDALVGDPQRCRAVLRDVLPEDEHRRAANVLSTAVQADVPRRLASAPVPDVVARPLAEQLTADFGIDSATARWAVATWAMVATGQLLAEDARDDQPEASEPEPPPEVVSPEPQRPVDPASGSQAHREVAPKGEGEGTRQPTGRVAEVAQATVADLKRVLPTLSRQEREELLAHERSTRQRKTAIAAIEASLAVEQTPTSRLEPGAPPQPSGDVLGWMLALVGVVLFGIAAVLGIRVFLLRPDENWVRDFILTGLFFSVGAVIGEEAYKRLTGKRAPWS